MRNEDFKAALAQFIQEHMPWPFIDVSRHDSEGTDAAWEIATTLEPAFQREFASIAETAKEVKRRTYPKAVKA